MENGKKRVILWENLCMRFIRGQILGQNPKAKRAEFQHLYAILKSFGVRFWVKLFTKPCNICV